MIDDDLGKSAQSTHDRSGFRQLMARIAAAEVGLVLVLEVSRLARDNADWHLLLRIAGFTDTLILDEGGIYDPNDSNDRLLLGFKNAISEFELHGMAARMHGGKVSAASRGDLKLPLPIGLVYDDDRQVALEPDRSIVDAIMLVFKAFRRHKSILGVARWMRRENIELPSRPARGARQGQVCWSLPNPSRLSYILKNPRYAGAYSYGRTKSQRGGDGIKRTSRLPMEQWHTLIPEHHVGFIDWDEFCTNQDIIAKNAMTFAPSPAHSASPRDGAALLQSRVICGQCGSRMKTNAGRVSATAKNSRYYYYRCHNHLAESGRRLCQSISAERVDEAVECFVIDAVNRQNIHLAFVVLKQLRTEFEQADAQRANRIAQFQYEADLAQRRFYEVDPSNRLVAATLESEWNDRLQRLQLAQHQRNEYRREYDSQLSDRQRLRIERLTENFERVWNADNTQNQDRKRLLALLIEDATLTRLGPEVKVQLRLCGGKAVTLAPVELPIPLAQQRRTPTKILADLDRMLDQKSDQEAAEELNRNGCRNSEGKPYSERNVKDLRRYHGLKCYREREFQRLRKQGYQSASEVAQQLGVNTHTIYKWGRQKRRVTKKSSSSEGGIIVCLS